MTGATLPERTKGRLDQWLWFARFVKSRSLAARLCATGLVTVNSTVARKPAQIVRIGDIVILPQGRLQRTARIVAIGSHRGPASEARMLYEETAAAIPISSFQPEWLLLLDETFDLDYRAPQTLPGPISR